MNEGPASAQKLLGQLKKDTLHYSLSENEMNLMGYQLMGNNMNALAFEVFKANLGLFPESWNVYDSYGEVLLKLGKKEEAIKMYQRSMELNPQNESGKKALEEILKK